MYIKHNAINKSSEKEGIECTEIIPTLEYAIYRSDDFGMLKVVKETNDSSSVPGMIVAGRPNNFVLFPVLPEKTEKLEKALISAIESGQSIMDITEYQPDDTDVAEQYSAKFEEYVESRYEELEVGNLEKEAEQEVDDVRIPRR